MSVEPRTHSASTEIGFTDWQVRIGVVLNEKIRLSVFELFHTIRQLAKEEVHLFTSYYISILKPSQIVPQCLDWPRRTEQAPNTAISS